MDDLVLIILFVSLLFVGYKLTERGLILKTRSGVRIRKAESIGAILYIICGIALIVGCLIYLVNRFL